MSLPSIFYGPGRAPGRPFRGREIDQLFEDLWRSFDASAAPPTGYEPAVDVVETEEAFHVVADLPGVEEKDVHVEVHGDTLSLRGEKRREHGTERNDVWHRAERSYGPFQRTFRVPKDVAGDKVSASFRNGVLVVTLPKAESARPREIRVTST